MPDSARRPNVVVFLTDQQRWDTLGVNGNPLDLTPNLDRMARYGTHAELAFTTNPVCGPARSTLQTGQFPTTTGVHRNGRTLSPDVPSLAGTLAAAGYHTGYIGKWHLSEHKPAVPASDRAGYQSWLASNLLEFTSDAYRTVLYDEQDDPVELPGYRADAQTDAAIRFLADRATQDEPFLLFCSYLEPHHQNHRDDYPAPEGYAQAYTSRWTPPDLAALGGTAPQHLGGYLGQIKRLDECLGRLLDALRSLNLADDTIVVFTSDHGSHFKTRNAEYKRSCHESSVHIPLVLHGPGFDGGGTLRELISLADLVPTLIDACGLDVPSTVQGRSIMPLLHGADTGDEWPDDVFIQVSESAVGRAVRTHRWKYYVEASEADAWNDAAASRYTESALYDLHADPYELNNLVGRDSLRAVRADLARRLVRRINEVEAVTAEIDPAESDGRGTPADPHTELAAVGTYRFGHQPKGAG